MLKSIAKATAVMSVTVLSCVVSEVSLVGGLVLSEAEAVIGRPLTPLSYAGVARRTTRRMIYATSVYVSTLPRGCSTVIIDGTSLYQCGATYYQPAGARYVVVRVE